MNPVLVVGSCAALLFVAERLWPSVELPARSGWWLRMAVLNLAQVGVVYLGAWTWDRYLPSVRLWDASRIGLPAGLALGYLAITFVYYWWHRARHEWPLLWRYLHQVHHSAARIEVLTSFYKHPLEIALNGVLSSTILYVLVGLAPASVAMVITITGVAELIYHSNLRTPYWMGFLFQRPESHRLHHACGWHRQNYSDLPLWDWLFGTLNNPRTVPPECGFSARAERQLWRLICGQRPS
jgi:sterol desaturase/sphingolipid hydroxylase (fatty acid hydroxylase superfamily)